MTMKSKPPMTTKERMLRAAVSLFQIVLIGVIAALVLEGVFWVFSVGENTANTIVEILIFIGILYLVVSNIWRDQENSRKR